MNELFPIEKLLVKPLRQRQVVKPIRKPVDYEQRMLNFDGPLKRDLTLQFMETYAGFGIYRKGSEWIAGHNPKGFASRAKARAAILRMVKRMEHKLS